MNRPIIIYRMNYPVIIKIYYTFISGFWHSGLHHNYEDFFQSIASGY
jgi:hypothetical protein